MPSQGNCATNTKGILSTIYLFLAKYVDTFALFYPESECGISNYIFSPCCRSVLHYSPSTQNDYGTVLCFANNEIGRQREPCQFHVIPAGMYIHTTYLRKKTYSNSRYYI